MNDLRAQLGRQMERVLADIPPRQRPLLFIGLGLLVLLLLWLLLLAPLSSSRAELKGRIAIQEEDLAWMQRAAAQVRGVMMADGAGARGGGASPLAAVDNTARQLGLAGALQRVEPSGSREVRVWLESAPFDDLLRWLALLQSAHAIEVSEIVVEPDRGGAGLVGARLTLIRE